MPPLRHPLRLRRPLHRLPLHRLPRRRLLLRPLPHHRHPLQVDAALRQRGKRDASSYCVIVPEGHELPWDHTGGGGGGMPVDDDDDYFDDESDLDDEMAAGDRDELPPMASAPRRLHSECANPNPNPNPNPSPSP